MVPHRFTGEPLLKTLFSRQKRVTNMEYNKRKLGAAYEQAAGRFLENNGFRVLEYNYRCRMGEVDIIGMDGEYLVFCEVKYRKSNVQGHPLEAVDKKKQRTLCKCASYYIMVNNLTDIPCRFDVVGILEEEITHVENAFDFIG